MFWDVPAGLWPRLKICGSAAKPLRERARILSCMIDLLMSFPVTACTTRGLIVNANCLADFCRAACVSVQDIRNLLHLTATYSCRPYERRLDHKVLKVKTHNWIKLQLKTLAYLIRGCDASCSHAFQVDGLFSMLIKAGLNVIKF